MRDIKSPFSLQMAPFFECSNPTFWNCQQLWNKCVGYISIWNGAGRKPLVDHYVFSSEEQQQQQQQKCDFIHSFSLKWREQREMEPDWLLEDVRFNKTITWTFRWSDIWSANSHLYDVVLRLHHVTFLLGSANFIMFQYNDFTVFLKLLDQIWDTNSPINSISCLSDRHQLTDPRAVCLLGDGRRSAPTVCVLHKVSWFHRAGPLRPRCAERHNDRCLR